MAENLIDNELVDRIVHSDSFGTSETYVNLLKYLIECTRSGNIPKEATIGNQVFGSNTAEDFDNAKVRVYIFNLRKKLKKYYDNEGIIEELEISIPKGSYKVEISKRHAPYKRDKTNRLRTIAISSLVVLIISIILNVIFWTEKQ